MTFPTAAAKRLIDFSRDSGVVPIRHSAAWELIYVVIANTNDPHIGGAL
jgi:hypothetical protein